LSFNFGNLTAGLGKKSHSWRLLDDAYCLGHCFEKNTTISANYNKFQDCFFGFFFKIMTSDVTAAVGSNTASILLIKMPKSSLLDPGEDGNGSNMLGGD
jgi:hypothetical protein